MRSSFQYSCATRLSKVDPAAKIGILWCQTGITPIDLALLGKCVAVDFATESALPASIGCDAHKACGETRDRAHNGYEVEE